MRLPWSGVVLKDLAQSCKVPLGEGFLSSVGYLLWMAAAAIALFAASTRQIQGSVLNRQFAFCGGGFSLWLCLDDMFLVHDRYLGEAFLYITYAFFTGLLLFRFRGSSAALRWRHLSGVRGVVGPVGSDRCPPGAVAEFL